MSGLGDAGAADVLGAFAAREAGHTVDDAARARAAEVLLDCLGVALAGTREEVASGVADLDEGGREESLVLGAWRRMPAATAALANGTAAHALDWDDVQQPWYGHPTAVLLPAAVAVAERRRAPGRDLVTAYLVGLAVGDALGALLNTDHYEHGWHPTSTLGSLAAAAACAHLLGADAAQAADAVGIAASTTGGLRSSFGSDVKAVHAGVAARNGVVAALMASRGVRASRTVLDGRFGFASVLGGGRLPVAELRERLDEGLAAPLRRVGLKLRPACAATNPAVDAVLALRRRHRLAADDVRDVECIVEPLATSLLTFERPTSVEEARFSLQHCVAAALVDGALGLAQMDDARVRALDVRDLGARVRVVTDPSVPARGDFPATVTVTLADGRRLTEHAAQARGKPGHPLDRDGVLAKFHAAAAECIPAPAVRVAERLLDVDSWDDVRTWTTDLAVAARTA